ncbi:MAG: hypothetical protein JNG90_02455, partial [Planctomycetaceae bacterium]|nr:hypothetical protein [Planctomycetaceae bacterium]
MLRRIIPASWLRSLLGMGLASVTWAAAAAADEPATTAAKPEPKIEDYFCLRGIDPVSKQFRHPACGVFYSELFRQALLIAARDEYQLITRDEKLGDRAYDPNIRWYQLDLHDRPNLKQTEIEPGQLKIDVIEGQGRNHRTLHTIAPPQYSIEKVDWLETLEFAETASREQFVEVLHQAKFSRKANPRRDSGAVPPAVEKRLAALSLAGHFAALRELHAMMQDPGESPEVLGALARTYANLGLLTEHFWQPLHKAYRARAVLYAQRLVHQQPESANAYWHRAYAAALVGLPKLAAADLEQAAKLATDQTTRPEWVELIDAYTHWDLDRLAACVQKSPDDSLAHLLNLLANNQPAALSSTIECGIEAAARAPECLRILEIMNTAGGVALRHETTTAPFSALLSGLPVEILGMREPPAASVKLAREIARRQQNADPEDVGVPLDEYIKLLKSLRTRDAALADRGEPSYAALKELLMEGAFAAAWRRADFLAKALAVPADEFVQEIKPLVADHPFQALLSVHLSNPPKRTQDPSRAILRPEFKFSERARPELVRVKLTSELHELLATALQQDAQLIDPGIYCDELYVARYYSSRPRMELFQQAHPDAPDPIIGLINSSTNGK